MVFKSVPVLGVEECPFMTIRQCLLVNTKGLTELTNHLQEVIICQCYYSNGYVIYIEQSYCNGGM